MTCRIHRSRAVWESLYQLLRDRRMIFKAGNGRENGDFGTEWSPFVPVRQGAIAKRRLWPTRGIMTGPFPEENLPPGAYAPGPHAQIGKTWVRERVCREVWTSGVV